MLERRLWANGVCSWKDVLAGIRPAGLKRCMAALTGGVEESQRELLNGNACYFQDRLPVDQHWRIFPHFMDATGYLDIETSGTGERDYITTIALYDGTKVHCYVQGHNLEEFVHDIRLYKVIVTYNGKRFDVPRLERYFDVSLNQVHLDLCPLLRSVGLHGGLKACERRLGITRGELDGLDGFWAILLWRDFFFNGNPRALETLLAYNVEDVLHLEALMVFAYNQKAAQTPVGAEYQLPLPAAKSNPFKADLETIARLRAHAACCRL